MESKPTKYSDSSLNSRATKSWLIQQLRFSTTLWSGRYECIKRYTKEFDTCGLIKSGPRKGKTKKIQLVECQHCKKLFPKTEIEVDHIEEIGPFKGDWNDYLARMFCGQDNLQTLCIGCHKLKTRGYNTLRRAYEPTPIANTTIEEFCD